MGNPKNNLDQLAEKWKSNWVLARETWSPFVKIREPEWCFSAQQASDQGLSESFAMIRLSDHRIVIDLEKVAQYRLEAFAVEVLAHELGHHIYTPANLHDNALLLSRIAWGLADMASKAPFVANLYSDILINHALQRRKNLDMAGVFRRLNESIPSSKLWTLIMRCYEYLWKLERGLLASKAEFHSAAIDADASLTASLVRSYSKNWLEGAGRFAALLYPYLMDEEEYKKIRLSLIVLSDAEKAGEGGGIIAGLADLDWEGMEGAIDPRKESNAGDGEKNAPSDLSLIQKEGGVGPQQRYMNPGRYIDLQKQINSKANEQEIINNYYREIALPHLVPFPLENQSQSSLSLPEGTESWEVSDPVEEIDWIETALAAPTILPGYNTVKRSYGPDNLEPETKKAADIYIGIDCSGSMGNPRTRFSWPVLSATVIGLSALRAGAKVMACLSGEPGSFMETDGFRSSEQEILTLLTSYLGTGYAFGVPRLVKPFGSKAKHRTHIVLVTDDDLFSMLDAKKEAQEESNWTIIESALVNAGGVGTIVLHSKREWRKTEISRLTEMGWHIYFVTNEQEMLEFAHRFSKDHYQL